MCKLHFKVNVGVYKRKGGSERLPGKGEARAKAWKLGTGWPCKVAEVGKSQGRGVGAAGTTVGQPE